MTNQITATAWTCVGCGAIVAADQQHTCPTAETKTATWQTMTTPTTDQLLRSILEELREIRMYLKNIAHNTGGAWR